MAIYSSRFASTSLPFFFFTAPATTEIYTLSLHDALPICSHRFICCALIARSAAAIRNRSGTRSEEHTSELQSRFDLVCRLLLEKKKNFARMPPGQHLEEQDPQRRQLIALLNVPRYIFCAL